MVWDGNLVVGVSGTWVYILRSAVRLWSPFSYPGSGSAALPYADIRFLDYYSHFDRVVVAVTWVSRGCVTAGGDLERVCVLQAWW